MPPNHQTTFEGLCRLLGGTSLHSTEHAAEAARLIEYLQSLGFTIVTADDVLSAIKADPSEEELSAHRCVEGVAVSHASDGWWLLFPHGTVEASVRGPSNRSSLLQRDRAC